MSSSSQSDSSENRPGNPPGLLSGFLRWARVRQARPYVKGRVLDYGCGQGYFSQFVSVGNYIGVDLEPQVIELARNLSPEYTFMAVDALPETERFDTIISLAVIEHVSDPLGFMKAMAVHLAPGGRIVITTPEPSFERFHQWGAALRLFSSHAAEDHESLLGHRQLQKLSDETGLKLVRYHRFLGGANQLAVYEHQP